MCISKQIFLFLCLLTSTFLFGQIPKHIFNEVNEEAYSAKDFTSKPKPIKQRVGVYGFGESEGEWDLVLLQNADSLIIQLWNGEWSTNMFTKKQCWLTKCKTFNKVTVQGNKIFFGKYSGLFTEYKYGKKITNSLLLFGDPIEERNYGKDSPEVGQYTTSIETYYGDTDRYSLSTNLQPDSFFKSKTKAQLKIMRNTIYANYGLLFQSGGDMEKYFRKKNWYNPFRKDVSNCLTEIEKKNIETTTRLEQL